MSSRRSRCAALGVLIFCLVAVGVAPFVGEAIDFDSQRDRYIFFELRLPRVLLGLCCGAGLAVAGVIMQAMLRNPLATPYTLGVSTGAALGVVIAIAAGVDGLIGYQLGRPLVGMAGAVLVIAFFAFYEIGGKPAGLALWRLFGTTNQLLAGLALLTVSLYLHQRGKNPWFTAVPMVFMLLSTFVAMFSNLRDFYAQWSEGGSVLFLVGLILLVLAVWLTIEAAISLLRFRNRPRIDTMKVLFQGDPAESTGG